MPYLFEENAVERAAVRLGEMSRPVAPHRGPVTRRRRVEDANLREPPRLVTVRHAATAHLLGRAGPTACHRRQSSSAERRAVPDADRGRRRRR